MSRKRVFTWTPLAVALPPKDGWYLVTWGHASGDSDLHVECSEYAKGFGFSDRWGANSIPLAWMPLPDAYKP